jgi:NarL family two-component system response regulator LiaR
MTEPKTIRIVVVDDHDLLRQGVVTCLSAFDDLVVVGDTNRGQDGVLLVERHEPDVVLMDLIMPGLSGVDAIRQIREGWPNVKIMALTSFVDASLVQAAIDAGATSYLLKSVDAENLADSIRMTAKGVGVLAPEATRQLASLDSSARLAQQLTKREREIARGLSNSDIAHELSLSIFTVKNHVSQVLTKLQVRSRTEAASVLLGAGSTADRV